MQHLVNSISLSLSRIEKPSFGWCRDAKRLFCPLVINVKGHIQLANVSFVTEGTAGL